MFENEFYNKYKDELEKFTNDEVSKIDKKMLSTSLDKKFSFLLEQFTNGTIANMKLEEKALIFPISRSRKKNIFLSRKWIHNYFRK